MLTAQNASVKWFGITTFQGVEANIASPITWPLHLPFDVKHSHARWDLAEEDVVPSNTNTIADIQSNYAKQILMYNINVIQSCLPVKGDGRHC